MAAGNHLAVFPGSMLKSQVLIKQETAITYLSKPEVDGWQMRRQTLEALQLAHLLVDSILDKKGANIVVLDVSEQTVFTDYFLLCDADNERQLKTLADAIAEDARKKAGIRHWAVEGDAAAGWVLVDFGDLVAHIFAPEQRNYYRLEELWSKGHTVLRIQ